MAVPKKRTSRTKSKSRRSVWMNKSNIQAERALSLAKSLAQNNNTTFVYSQSNTKDSQE